MDKKIKGTAIAYCRVSTLEQVAEGVSLSAQEYAARAYCEMRSLELVEVVVEEGVSAGLPLGSRPGGKRVVEAVTKGEAKHVVAMKLDRLFRDALDCLAVTAQWDRAGVALHLVDLGGQSVDTSTAMGRFFLTVMAGAAEMERNLIGERTRAALAHKARNGERVGQIPYGNRLGGDSVHLEPEPDEQKIINQIRNLHFQGIGTKAIAERLNSLGMRARGKRWHRTTVCRVLARNKQAIIAPTPTRA